MPLSSRFWKTYIALALLSLMLLAAPNFLWWLSATDAEQAWLLSRYPFLLVLVALVLGGIYALWLHTYQTHVRPIEQLTNALHQVRSGHPLPPLPQATTPELRKLQQAVADLTSRYRLQTLAPATGPLNHERNLLATLLGELPVAVLVCRTSGQILLYNEAARHLLESPAHPGAVGLGRSIFHSLDRELVVFALHELAYQLHQQHPNPTVHIATCLPSGQLVRVQAAPVRQTEDRLEAFMLILSPLQATDEPFELIRDVDLLQGLRMRLQQTGVSLQLDKVTEARWIRVHLSETLEMLYRLVSRLAQRTACLQWMARTLSEDDQVHLWLHPLGIPPSAIERFKLDLQDTWLDMLGHAHQTMLQRDANALHLTLPAPSLPHAGSARALLSKPPASRRPVYVDLSLLETLATGSLDDQLLRNLIYTVFDTETTGLHPEQGDEIIEIGAVRIVNSHIRSEETFEQLINPRRPLSLDSVRVHGIEPILLQDKPPIEEVLPRFYRFARDTVLVGHNVAFDLKFIRQKEKSLGLHFDQHVLDTMLLAAVVDPERPHYGLDELAAAFGIEPIGRHSALGDALITAELFLRLLPLLEQRGIRTLRQACEAIQQTRLARHRYGRIS